MYFRLLQGVLKKNIFVKYGGKTLVRRPKPPYWRGGTSFARKHVPPPFRGCSKAGLGLGRIFLTTACKETKRRFSSITKTGKLC